MRDVAIIAFAQTEHVRAESGRNEVEMLLPVLHEVMGKANITKDRVDFVCSGSSDYLAGQAFSFVMTLDAFGPWPPISESHVDMDGAWALYEAWVKMQIGAVDTALIYSYGKSSPGDIRRVLSRQLDPYYEGPIWAEPVALAALQARAMLDAGVATEADFAKVAADNRRNAMANPYAQVSGDADPADLLAAEPFMAPLRRHDLPPITDGCVAVMLAAGDVARELCERPAWIRGIDHRIDPHLVGMRDLTDAPSARLAAEGAAARAGWDAAGAVDVAELHAPYSPQEIVLRRAIGIGDDVSVNPSGGALAANPVMAAGLIRLGEAAQRITDGTANRALAHATSGACLQQNLVCLLEGE